MDAFMYEFIFPAAPHMNPFSRNLLSSEEDDTSEDAISEERLYNDAMRSLQFVVVFALFSASFCSLSFYVYSRPYDSPSGSSFVSKLRKLPFLGWFFRQPSFAVAQPPPAQEEVATEENVGLMDDATDDAKSPDVELGDTDKTTRGGDGETAGSTPKGPEKAAASATTAGATQHYYLFNSPNLTLLLCAVGLLVAYLTWGFMQERIMSHPYGDPEDEDNWFKSSEFCVLINRFFGLLVSTVALKFATRSGKDAAPFVLALCALSNMSSSWFQYESLHFVTFPVQTIFKSSKILITMAVGKIVQRKTFPLRKYLTALTVAVGVYVFLDGQKSESSGKDSDDLGYYFYLGLVMISAYAFCDAFTSNWQSKVFEQTKISSLEMMQGVNAFTFVVSLAFCVTDTIGIVNFYIEHPLIIFHSLLMGLCAGFGQVLIFYTIQVFGAVTFATVMTTRMVISVLISIWWYSHPMSVQGAVGMVITFIALFYQVYDKSKGRR